MERSKALALTSPWKGEVALLGGEQGEGINPLPDPPPFWGREKRTAL
jgi:hypothetical protein